MSLRLKNRVRPNLTYRFLLLICTALIVAGGLLTAISYAFAQRNVTKQTNLKFEEITNGHINELYHHLESYGGVLYATRGLFASAAVNADTWDRFVHAQSTPDRYTGMKAIAYAEVVPQESIKQYSRLLQETQDPSIRVHPAKSKDDYIVLKYHEEVALPDSVRLEALGFDLSSNPARAKALEKARMTGEMTATGLINIITSGKPGFLLILPLDDRLGSTEHSTFGYGIAALEIEKLINTVLGERLAQYRSSMRIVDITDAEPTPLYAKDFASWDRTVTRDVVVRVADRTWQVTFEVPTSSLLLLSQRIGPSVVLAMGIGLIISLCIIVYTLKLRRKLLCMPGS